uniref:Hist_deacetyl domain-containing protein n=1 Tax=Parastrongyloides trichosuri TaxID=131310 RepID=A0A0N4ZS93_PARTI
MLTHENIWDTYHVESPNRMTIIIDKLKEENLYDKLSHIPHLPLTVNDISLVHPIEYVQYLREICESNDENLIENFCRNHDSIYLNKNSYNCAIRAVECCWSVTDAVIKNRNSNGFALIRPPGHHAYKDNPNGFCLFNNIAICAKKAIKEFPSIKKILILDWDIHAAQGTQFSIKNDDSNIQLISIHRYENGMYWPHLEESNFDVPYYPNTLNIPLNEVGLNDFHYIHIICKIVLPFIFNYKPDLIMVSCGYDAAIGDPKGGMNLYPHFYGLITRILSNLSIPIALFFEGGYLEESISISAKETIAGLLEREVFNYYNLKFPVDSSSNFTGQLYWIVKQLSNKNIFFKNIEELKEYVVSRQVELIPLPKPSKSYLKYFQFKPPAVISNSYLPIDLSVKLEIRDKIEKFINNQNITRDINNLILIDFDDYKKRSITFRGQKFKEPINFEIDDLTTFTFLLSYVILPNIFLFSSNQSFNMFISLWKILPQKIDNDNSKLKFLFETIFEKYNLNYY